MTRPKNLVARALSGWQASLFAIVCALSVGLMIALVQAVGHASATIDSYENSGYVVTTLANLQREALRLNLSVNDLPAGGNKQGVELQRQLLQQQLNIVIPRLITSTAGASAVRAIEDRLEKVDTLLPLLPYGASSKQVFGEVQFTGSRIEIEAALTDLEREVKQLYDREERSFFASMGGELRAQQAIQRLLLALAAVIPLFTVSLILSLRHSFGSRFKAAYRQLNREMRERRKIEQFEQDRGRVLELAVRDAPVARILDELRDSLTHQLPWSTPTVLLCNGSQLSHAAGKPLTRVVESELRRALFDQSTEAGQAAPAVNAESWTSQADPDRDRCLLLHHGGTTYLTTSIPSNSLGGSSLGALVLSWPDHDPAAQACDEDARLLSRLGRLAGVALEHKFLSEQLAHRSLHDPLTDLGNSRLMQLNLEQSIGDCAKQQGSFALFFLDLDRFKWINDSQGHGAGDQLLIQVAERLRTCVATADVISRLGGDEFVILAPGLQGVEEIRPLAALINRRLAEPFTIGGSEYTISASIGISVYPDDGSSAESLLRSADFAMYQAKQQGKNRFVFASQAEERQIAWSVALEGALRGAVESSEFHLVFQPYFDVVSERLAGVEALLRWHHQEFGEVPPATFIPIAERAGLIVEIGRWALREACRQAVGRLQTGMRVAVNVSAVQFLQSGFVDDVVAALEYSGLAPTQLELELTESVLMEDLGLAEQRLSELRSLGVSVAIDDFGTGYSSLVYLHRLPIDTLKIDRFFIQDLESISPAGRHVRTLVETIVQMAHGLGLSVVAEGVETAEQLALVRQAGCDKVQGFLLAGASPLSDVGMEGELIHSCR